MNPVTLFKNYPTIKAIVISLFAFTLCAIPFIIGEPLFLLGVLFLGLTVFFLVSTRLKINYASILFLLIILSILTPPLLISTGLPRIRLEEILIYLFFPIILLFNLRSIQFDENAKRFLYIYCAFILSVVVSTMYGMFFLNVPVGTRDIFEIITISKYLLLFITIYSFNVHIRINTILYFILSVIVFSGFFGVMLYYGVLGFDTFFGELYLQDRVHIIDDRLVGTFKNPNTYSAILTFGHIIALTLFLTDSNNKRKPFLIIVLLLISFFMLLAGSRTMIVGYLIATVLVFTLSFFKSSLSKKQLIGILIVLGFGIIVSISFISYEILIRLESGIDFQEDESLALRVLAWYLNFQLYLESPILGWGPAKDMITTIVDSEYILILRRYGLIGIIVFMGFYLYPLKKAFYSFRNYSNQSLNSLNIVVISTICVFLLANITNSLFHNFQVMDLWVAFLAFYFNTTRIQGDKNIITSSSSSYESS